MKPYEDCSKTIQDSTIDDKIIGSAVAAYELLIKREVTPGELNGKIVGLEKMERYEMILGIKIALLIIQRNPPSFYQRLLNSLFK